MVVWGQLQGGTVWPHLHVSPPKISGSCLPSLVPPGRHRSRASAACRRWEEQLGVTWFFFLCVESGVGIDTKPHAEVAGQGEGVSRGSGRVGSAPQGLCPCTARARTVRSHGGLKTNVCRGAGACWLWMRSPGTGHGIKERFGWEWTFRGHPVQPPCSEQGHLQPDQVAQSPGQPGLERFQASMVPFSPGWTLGGAGRCSSSISPSAPLPFLLVPVLAPTRWVTAPCSSRPGTPRDTRPRSPACGAGDDVWVAEGFLRRSSVNWREKPENYWRWPRPQSQSGR